MALAFGFVKGKMTSLPRLQNKVVQHQNQEETQFHLHFGIDVHGVNWDIAANVGTDNMSDLLKYKIVQNFRHPIVETLRAAPEGKNDLTGTDDLPAIDFQRSGILEGTGDWLDSDRFDGREDGQPAAALQNLLAQAYQDMSEVYVFGRFYTEGNGIHDVHMNQGSSGRYVHREGNDRNDHDDIWQDGALMIDFGDAGWVAYFAAFTQQTVPTDWLGNPRPGGHSV